MVVTMHVRRLVRIDRSTHSVDRATTDRTGLQGKDFEWRSLLVR
ncbi:hypothetical protein Pd630_LPD16024 (plasmid) [Rhodococcus opacus PD630]|nr:hypothetical protein Pd630_LPD16024 [Rhodococcus opacus PD630]